MTNLLHIALAQNTTARAHIYGGEAVTLEKEVETLLRQAADTRLRAAARRRYWREIAAVEALMGRPSPEAERLGGAA
jgi:CII-binding regulator of phage lambda lysogenization HflD